MQRTPSMSDARVGYDTSRPLRSFVEISRDVLVRPADFFSRLRTSDEGTESMSSGPTCRQLLFTTICLYLGGILGFFFSALDPLLSEEGANVATVSEILRREPSYLLTIAAIVFLIWPLVAVLTLYIGAFFQQMLVRLFIGRGNRSYWVTFPIVAYSSAIALVSWVPVVGIVVSLYSIYIRTCGLRAMHDTTTKKALLAALPPPLIGLVFAAVPYFQAL